jgi:hypothetical protein
MIGHENPGNTAFRHNPPVPSELRGGSSPLIRIAKNGRFGPQSVHKREMSRLGRLFGKKGLGALVTTGIDVGLIVVKDTAVPVRGYATAVRRLEDAAALGDSNPDDVYISLTEAAHWLSSIAEQKGLRGDVDVQALIFARNRAHHWWASVTYFDRNCWRWRPESQLPVPDKPKHVDEKRGKIYRERLEEQPILDVMHRLLPTITALAPNADVS